MDTAPVPLTAAQRRRMRELPGLAVQPVQRVNGTADQVRISAQGRVLEQAPDDLPGETVGVRSEVRAAEVRAAGARPPNTNGGCGFCTGRG